jgi:hypothetical protein
MEFSAVVIYKEISMQINYHLNSPQLQELIGRFWKLSGEKIKSIQHQYDGSSGSPVVTVEGKYIPRSWTDWTQGFQYGSSILQFDAQDDEYFLEIGIKETRDKMAGHVSHFGVHDHGFNNQSTYGNLLRLLDEGRYQGEDWMREYYSFALRLSASVQAKRWTKLPDGGFIYSFNGPHSLFVDTIRTIRVLILGHLLGHHASDENDIKIDLLSRGFSHALATAKYSVFYGEGRDYYDEWGRTAHESIFNINDGNFRCPGTQQGFSGFSTWTRGLSWAMLGFSEQLELLQQIDLTSELEHLGGKDHIEAVFLKAARATCDFYIDNSALDGVPYWDTGAPGLANIPDWREHPSDPYNKYEPVDSSAAAIGAQGLLRLGHYLKQMNDADADKYWQAGLTVANTLLQAPYLSHQESHQGLILHSIYHRPNGWDHIPENSDIPHSESSMWGDYHARELMLYLHRIIHHYPYYTYYNSIKHG